MTSHVHNSNVSFVPVLKAVAGVSFLALCIAAVAFPYVGIEQTLVTQIGVTVLGAIAGAWMALHS